MPTTTELQVAGDKPTDTVKSENGEEEKAEALVTAGIMKRLLSEAPEITCSYRMGVFAAFMTGLGMLGFAKGFSFILEVIAEPDIKAEAWKIPVVFFSFGIYLGIGNTIFLWLFARVGGKIAMRLREKFYLSLLMQDITFYDFESSGGLQAMLAAETKVIENGLGTQYGMCIEKVGEFVGGFALAFYESWLFTCIMLALLPALLCAGAIQGKFMASLTSSSGDKFAKAYARSSDVIGGIKTVKSLGAEQDESKAFNNLIGEIWPTVNKSGLMGGVGLGTMLFMMFGFMYGIGMYIGAILIAERDDFDAAELFAAFFGIVIGGMGLGTAGPAYQEITKGKLAAAKLYKIIDREPQIKHADANVEPYKTPIQGDIELRDVTFAYPSRQDVTVFKNFNLTIEAGQTVALVGPSGCGKSTIVGLIERFYDPNSGSVLIDGREIHNYDLPHLRSQIGLVGQEPVLFDTTIAENIRMGNSFAGEISDDDIREAAMKSNAHEFIMGFPDKYDTSVGEGGSQMSGGQKQRISIARAICRKPRILLLDEATSALDTESEKVVQEALDKLMFNSATTCIVVAHRLSTIKDADKIVVMHEGLVVQVGTHQELSADTDGIYYTMLKAQDLMGLPDNKERRNSLRRQGSHSSLRGDKSLTNEGSNARGTGV